MTTTFNVNVGDVFSYTGDSGLYTILNFEPTKIGSYKVELSYKKPDQEAYSIGWFPANILLPGKHFTRIEQFAQYDPKKIPEYDEDI